MFLEMFQESLNLKSLDFSMKKVHNIFKMI
jgi:hypothetical protein